jgi:hypothetical protein
MRSRLMWSLTQVTRALAASLLLLTAATPTLAQQRPTGAPAAQAQRFPHDQHAKLFPQCAGCHAGITRGDRGTMFPDTVLCVECHNNRDQKRVAWRAPVRTASNLKFDHDSHEDVAGSQGATCTTCHATSGARWMHVTRAKPEQCQSCHSHRATAHLAPDNRCAACHVNLPQAPAISAARIASFPKPPSHDAKGFETAHGPAAVASPAQCAVCHAKETCATCHVNASAVSNRYQLAPDARVAGIVRGRSARYPTPASHASRDFIISHGVAAQQGTATCATCHARSSCQACHTGPLGGRTVTEMPLPEPGGARGVQLNASPLPWKSVQGTTVPSEAPLGTRFTLASFGGDTTRRPLARQTQVHPVGFARTHGSQAATDRPSCEGCHTKTYCTQCHAGESTRRFHKPNFVARHAPEAYGRETDCQSCHSRELFCRSCHMQLGMNSKGKVGGGYHNGAALWIIQHGQAARQELQSCTTCHQQRDCMQCHSQSGRNVNPHGRGFNAEKSWKANRLICLRCHLKDPLGRNGP